MTDRPKTGKRIQVYLAARHRAWWDTLPRYERSQVIAKALDLYRDLHGSDSADARNVPNSVPASNEAQTD